MNEKILEEPTSLAEMKYTEHLKELRKRLIYIFSALLLVFLILLPFAKHSYDILSQPLVKLLPANTSMIAIDVMSTFVTPFKLNLYLAFLITIPFTLYQIWHFIAPALYQTEKKLGLTILTLSTALFFLGMFFSYTFILPLALKFFILASPENVLPMTDISSYLGFCIKLFLAFGLAFQIPILTYLLILTGILSTQQLEQHRKHIIVFFFFIAMFITPPDIFSMLALAIPMWLLFEIGLFFTKLSIKTKS